ncbi:MAG: response regulator [Elusimicrobia bacterium]|nr:response regulator [Elusimicrobiota bacterium]
MKKTVLVCDDDADLRRILVRLLSPYARVLEAADGEAALRLIAAEAPDVVLLDVTMPGRSGLETLQAYRGRRPCPATIMLTGTAEIAIAREALRLGAVEYVTKPFDPKDLREEVRRRLEENAGDGPPREGGRPWRVAGE